MPDVLTPELIDEVRQLGDELIERFTPPEYIPGCTVKGVGDKDEYAVDNGWIECIVAQHNQQRCRWRGQYSGVAVNDIVDVLYFKSYRLFVVFGQGGVSATKSGSGTWPGADEIKVNGVTYTDFSTAITAAADNDAVLIGPGTFDCEDVTVSGKGLTFKGSGREATILSNITTVSDQPTLTLSGDVHSVEDLSISTSSSFSGATTRGLVLTAGATVNIKNVQITSASVLSGTSYGIELDATGGGSTLAAVDALVTGSASTAYGLYIDNLANNKADLYNGLYRGSNDGINATNGTLILVGPDVDGGVTFGGSLTLNGYYFDEDENAVVIANPGYLLLEELASDPTTPPTGHWGLYFKAGGLYHIDDAGTVTGPIT